jgi:hypothetical protein
MAYISNTSVFGERLGRTLSPATPDPSRMPHVFTRSTMASELACIRGSSAGGWASGGRIDPRND